MILVRQPYYRFDFPFFVMLLSSARAKRKALFGKAFLIELERGNYANATLFAKAFLRQNGTRNNNGAYEFIKN